MLCWWGRGVCNLLFKLYWFLIWGFNYNSIYVSLLAEFLFIVSTFKDDLVRWAKFKQEYIDTWQIQEQLYQYDWKGKYLTFYMFLQFWQQFSGHNCSCWWFTNSGRNYFVAWLIPDDLNKETEGRFILYVI